jgi:hypothetical protein
MDFEEIMDQYRREGKISLSLETLSVSDYKGWTVAHELVSMGQTFWDTEILGLKDHEGWTVAHEMARLGNYIDDRTTLELITNYGVSVGETMNSALTVSVNAK